MISYENKKKFIENSLNNNNLIYNLDINEQIKDKIKKLENELNYNINMFNNSKEILNISQIKIIEIQNLILEKNEKIKNIK